MRDNGRHIVLMGTTLWDSVLLSGWWLTLGMAN